MLKCFLGTNYLQSSHAFLLKCFLLSVEQCYSATVIQEIHRSVLDEILKHYICFSVTVYLKMVREIESYRSINKAFYIVD